MYPLSHIYVSSQILDEMDASLALGSVLPDVLVGTGILWRKAHHSTGEPFQEHLHSPSLRIGAALHGIDLPGLDFFSDVSYAEGKGYAYQKAVHIKQDIMKLGVKQEHALWRGHNFVEMAIEIALNNQHSQFWRYLEQGQQDDNLMAQIARLAIELEATQPDAAPLVLDRFLTIRGQKKDLAQDYATKLNRIYSLAVEPAQCETIITKAMELIEPDYRQFLNSSIRTIQLALADSTL
ncbi:MAG: hypothetical protein GX262_01165 [Clostridia bacterium]|nr:hypothetical protein [Clostridia bacterium]